jgi:hypothetical protein
MARKCRFTFLVDTAERDTINLVAAKLRRTPSDALRYLVHQAASELDVRHSASERQQRFQAHDRNGR